MKILFCINSLGYGGAEKSLSSVANGLCLRNHEVSVCTLKTQAITQKLNPAVQVVELPEFSGHAIKRVRQLRQLCRLCKQEKPDLLVSFLTMPNMLCAIAGCMTNTPVIISERGDPYTATSLTSRLIYGTYRLAKGAVFQTDGAKAFFNRSMQQKGTVIPNPVVLKDDTVFADYGTETKSIVFAARFELRQKRQDLMLRAFARVLEKYPDYRLDFYGDGQDEQSVKELVREMGLEESVVFNGVSATLLQDMAKAEMFVLSSDYEGIPNSLIEAMAIGLPCISTDCSPGGARMLIEDGVNGIIVPKDDEQALANAICRFIEDRNFAVVCGENAKQIRQRFAPERIIDMWENYCEKIAK